MTSDPAGDTTRVRFAVLGPLEVRVDDHALALGGVKPRTLLALLLTDGTESFPPRGSSRRCGVMTNERSPSTLQVHVHETGRHARARGRGTRRTCGRSHATARLRRHRTTPRRVDTREFRDLVASGQQQAGRGGRGRHVANLRRHARVLVHGVDPPAGISATNPSQHRCRHTCGNLTDAAASRPIRGTPSSPPGTTARSSVRSKRRLPRSRSTAPPPTLQMPRSTAGRRRRAGAAYQTARRVLTRTSSASIHVRRAPRPRESHPCAGRNARGADRDGQRRRAADGAAFECAHPFGPCSVFQSPDQHTIAAQPAGDDDRSPRGLRRRARRSAGQPVARPRSGSTHGRFVVVDRQ